MGEGEVLQGCLRDPHISSKNEPLTWVNLAVTLGKIERPPGERRETCEVRPKSDKNKQSESCLYTSNFRCSKHVFGHVFGQGTCPPGASPILFNSVSRGPVRNDRLMSRWICRTNTKSPEALFPLKVVRL